MTAMLDNPFQLHTLPGPFHRRATFALARPLLSWLLNAPTLGALYERVDAVPAERFEERALRVLDIETECSAHDLSQIPPAGPVIIASNHPHGVLDGLVVAALVSRVRPDVRIVANYLLERIPELGESCFFVDPFEGRSATARSGAGLRAALRWLKDGGAIAMFPAGEVAHDFQHGLVPADGPWRDTLGRLARSTDAAVVPAFIDGKNSALFYTAGRLHPVFRTMLLGRELLGKRGARVPVRFGSPLRTASTEEGGAHTSASAVVASARAASNRLQPAVRCDGSSPVPGDNLSGEIARLPRESVLVESGHYQVFCCAASAIPIALQEIGRLRAIAYRGVGEGSGSECDLDRFDRHYLHLFSWDTDQRRIVGAYRLGRTDEILRTHGVHGLYSRTLFQYGPEFLERLSPALELGRSFVRQEDQRNHNALFLLWKGIGRFVCDHPQYRHLFGLVSISARYADVSHAILRTFLEQNHLDESLAQLVQALNPLAPKYSEPATRSPVIPRTLDEADRLIASLEDDGKAMPVLLRQYLKLNARLIGFNVDANFGDALDALMTVDLGRVSLPILTRYLGHDVVARLLAHGSNTHSLPQNSASRRRPQVAVR